MPNQLYNILGSNNSNAVNNNFQKMVQQYKQFKAGFQGDPKKEVEKLLQSGRMSQQQLNQLQDMAKQFQELLK